MAKTGLRGSPLRDRTSESLPKVGNAANRPESVSHTSDEGTADSQCMSTAIATPNASTELSWMPKPGTDSAVIQHTRRCSESAIRPLKTANHSRRSSVDPSESVRRGRSFWLPPKSARSELSKTTPPSPSQASETTQPEIASPLSTMSSNVAQDSDQRLGSPVSATVPQDSDDEDQVRGRKRTVEETILRPKSPTVTITEPSGQKTTSKSFPLRPRKQRAKTVSRERFVAPIATDLESLDEIRNAQRLGIASTTREAPHRVVRTLLRGDFRAFPERARDYFLAANLSKESTYATEWAIGSVLRDGDTLMVMFAIDKDAETGLPEESLNEGDLSKTAREITAEVDEMTKAASRKPSLLAGVKNMLPGSRRNSITTDARVSHKELESLTELCIQRLRKTKLQVRVVIEVIHCKNARHMLLEAIDSFKPTLVIVGSRGRSMVKGALAMSFSRYLIAKSSVPVMTARMKPSSRKVGSPQPRIRLANNLVPSRGVANVSAEELEQRLKECEALPLKQRLVGDDSDEA